MAAVLYADVLCGPSDLSSQCQLGQGGIPVSAPQVLDLQP